LGKELFRQLEVGRVEMLRLRFRFACGLAGKLFEHPAWSYLVVPYVRSIRSTMCQHNCFPCLL